MSENIFNALSQHMVLSSAMLLVALCVGVGGELYDPRSDEFYRRRRRRLEENHCPEGLCCQRCRDDLEYCGGVLQGKVVEDTYYFAERQDDGVCYDIDKRAGALDVFGPSKTFRDTPECRRLVQHYSCLWWASSSEAYANRCDEESPDTPVHPCRSYCTQIATQCANSLEYMDLCLSIRCPPTDDTCEPGPEDTSPLSCRIWKYTSAQTDDAPYLAPPIKSLLLLLLFPSMLLLNVV